MNRQVLFSLDILINRKAYKLPVLYGDSLQELTLRLFELTSTKKEKQDKVAMRLNGQLQVLLKNDLISQKIRNTIKSILNRVINEVQQDRNGSIETPFRILQDSILHSKLNCKQNSMREYRHPQNEVKLKYAYNQQELQQYEAKSQKSPTFQQYLPEEVPRVNKVEYGQILRNMDRCQYESKKDYSYNNDRSNKYYSCHNKSDANTNISYAVLRNHSNYEMDSKFSKLNLSPSKASQDLSSLYPLKKPQVGCGYVGIERMNRKQRRNEGRIRKYNYLDTQFQNQ